MAIYGAGMLSKNCIHQSEKIDFQIFFVISAKDGEL